MPGKHRAHPQLLTLIQSIGYVPPMLTILKNYTQPNQIMLTHMSGMLSMTTVVFKRKLYFPHPLEYCEELESDREKPERTHLSLCACCLLWLCD